MSGQALRPIVSRYGGCRPRSLLDFQEHSLQLWRLGAEWFEVDRIQNAAASGGLAPLVCGVDDFVSIERGVPAVRSLPSAIQD